MAGEGPATQLQPPEAVWHWKGAKPWKQDGYTYELTGTQLHVQGLHGSAPGLYPRAGRRNGHMPSSLTQKQFLTDNHLPMKIYFPPRESHWGKKLLWSVGLVLSSRWPKENKLNGITLEVPCLVMLYRALSSSHPSSQFYLIIFILFQLYILFYLTGFLSIYYDVQWVSVSSALSWDFSLCFSSNVLVFVHRIIFYYYPLEACWFSNEVQKWGKI